MPITLMENVQHEEWDRVVDINCKVVTFSTSHLGCSSWNCLLFACDEEAELGSYYQYLFRWRKTSRKSRGEFIIAIWLYHGILCYQVLCWGFSHWSSSRNQRLQYSSHKYPTRSKNEGRLEGKDVGTDIGMESTDKQAIHKLFSNVGLN